MNNLIFISSPYTNNNPNVVEENYIKVPKLAAHLCSEGKIAISPITYGHTLLQFKEMPGDWEFWKTFCLSLLVKCDELIVYKMEGWENSRGMKAEIEFAETLGIKITYLEYQETW